MVANLNDASITLENNDVKTPAEKTRPCHSIHSPLSVFQSDLIRPLPADGILSIDWKKNRRFLICNNTAIAFKYFGNILGKRS